jgi:uncharacterized membrane protein
MADITFHQMNKKTWYKWSFYINIILFFIVAISIFFLIIDSYNAGKIFNAGGDILSQAWLNIARDIAFLSISLALIFFQFFRNMLKIMRRSL